MKELLKILSLLPTGSKICFKKIPGASVSLTIEAPPGKNGPCYREVKFLKGIADSELSFDLFVMDEVAEIVIEINTFIGHNPEKETNV
jgi:hypothetical protein